MRYLTSFLGCAILALSSMGCISTTMYGTTEQTVLSPGAGEGEVIRKHGAPDNIVYLGEPYYNPTTGERGAVDKYLYEYRIGGGTTLLGWLYASDEFHNVCYLIEDGVVKGGGTVAEGSGSIILGANMGVVRTPLFTLDLRFGGYLHPKVRAGYGGDGNPWGDGPVPD
ncbi:MAG: hypothetical protein KDD82_27130 [Planctomycetes bacterium]|nr:hypothetical protein [Planctomycetota bacterium]